MMTSDYYHIHEHERHLSMKAAIIAILFSIAVNIGLLVMMHQLRQAEPIQRETRYKIVKIDMVKSRPKQTPVAATTEPGHTSEAQDVQRTVELPPFQPPLFQPTPAEQLPVSFPLDHEPMPAPDYDIIRSEPPLISQDQPTAAREMGVDHAVDRKPRAIHRPDPDYPLSAKRRGIEGWVDISFVVNRDGTPSHIEIVGSSSSLFHWAAIAAIEQWRFEPALKDGQAVPGRLRQRVIFSFD